MADVITRLKLESGEYDSKIKRATQGLLQMEQECRKVGGTLAILEKDQTEFVRSLGKMQTVSNTARGRLSELTSAFTDLSVQYNRLTKEEKQGDFGRALSSSLGQLKTRIREARSELDGITRSLGKSGGGFNQLFSGVAGRFGMSPAMFTGVGAAIAGIGAAAKLAGDNIRTAFNFEKSMSGLSALTGKTGKELEQLKEYAIELGSTTTLTASQVADAFRLIGSQQPQLLESSEALKEVTKYAIRLSEAAGIDLATASQTLSTSINQMGGDSNNAARYVNVLAAASQKGAGDIAWLGEALTKSATAAKAVGTDYEELVANLEQLAKGGFDASTAGTALRSIIMNLEKQANQDFKPSIVGLTQAFENLGKAELDITGYQQIAGKMFATQAKVLADAAGEARNMTEAITGTNIAEEQATTNTANLDGSLKALASAWEGLNLHINSSNGFLKDCVDWLKETVQWADAAFTSAGRAKAKLDSLRGGPQGSENNIIQRDLNKVMSSEDPYAEFQRIAATYTESETAKWRAVNEAKARLAILNRSSYDPYGKKIKEQEIIDKNTEWAQQFRALGDEFRQKGKQYLDSLKPAETKTKIKIEAEDEEAKKSIKELQNEIKTLKQLRDEAADAGDTKMVADYNAQIKSIQEEIKSMRGGSTSPRKTVTKQEITPLQQAQKQISSLSVEALTADEDRLEVIKKEVAALNEQLKVYKEIQNYVNGIEPDYSKPVLPDRKAFEADQKKRLEAEFGKPTMLQSMAYSTMKEINAENVKVDTNTLHTLIKDALQNSIDTTSLNLESISEQIGQGINVPDEAWQGILDKYNELREQIGEEPIQIDFATGKIADDGKKTKEAWKEAASAVQSVGSAFAQIKNPAARVAGIIAEAIANVALSFSKALSSESKSIWTWIAAAASGTATMFATISAIQSATSGKYAEGGIIPGNSYSGDNLMASVNAGELILNRAAQGNLASQLQGAGQQQGGSTPFVSGEQIYLGLSNYLRRSGRGELLTARG